MQDRQDRDHTLVNQLKGLVIDGVNKAKSGHPGGPMSSMDFAYILFTEYLRFDPDDATWMGRDRFILSAGHMSMLQYSMLYGIGWLQMDDLKKFRQLGSRTPGHPENHGTPGVECTTGPLGQGAAMSVGFALAALHHGATLDKSVFNQRVFAIVSDGDLQEGVAMGAASFAGHKKINNLVWLYDKNDVQLSGPTSQSNSDDDVLIYRGFGWHVIDIDGHDHAKIRAALTDATSGKHDRPVLIVCRTIIGKGCVTMENSSKTHGSPLPEPERVATKAHLGIPAGQDFFFPEESLTHFRRNFAARRKEAAAWRETFEAKRRDAAFAKAYDARFTKLDTAALPVVDWPRDKTLATRNAFGDVITKWAPAMPRLIGGSADLAPSNMTEDYAKAVGSFTAENRAGRNIDFGVREFPMSGISNGLALFGGLIPFDATFLAFADYSRGALRLGAIQKAHVLHEFTHDSFHVGEDGPTHQPVEHAMALRAIPDLYVMRPADAVETEALMRKALSLQLPSAILLTRQKLPFVPLDRKQVQDATRGAYAAKPEADPEYLFLATGSELGLALDVAKRMTGKRVRVVSMPCWELFDEQDAAYKEAILPKKVTRRVSFEAGTTFGWDRYTGMNGLKIGLDHYGASAPAEALAVEFGFTPEAVLAKIAAHAWD